MTTTTASMKVFALPDLGEGLSEAELVRWLVAVGDEVEIDQPVVEVETAKAVVEVPVPFAGRVVTLHATEGDTVLVGAPLIEVATANITAPSTPDAATEADRDEERAGSGSVLVGYGTDQGRAHGRRRRRPPAVSVPSSRGREVPRVISPLVRGLARERGVDLVAVTPSGAGGVITRRDIEQASGVPAGVPGGERRVPLGRFRKALSANLSRSRAEIPEATVWVDVDATALWQLRESARAAEAAGPGLLGYLARFVVAALKEYPVFNARLDTERDEIVELEQINLGIAVQTGRGLLVPAVVGAQTMTTTELDREIRALIARAREGRATRDELAAGTFTLNNYGSLGVDGSAAIINHPQVAILGFGRMLDRPWVVDGAIGVRKITQLSFVFDHRVSDGGTAAAFMRSVADAMENPTSVIARL